MGSTSSSARLEVIVAAAAGAVAGGLVAFAFEREAFSPWYALGLAALAWTRGEGRAAHVARLGAFGLAFALVCARFVPTALSARGDASFAVGALVLGALAVVEAVRFSLAGIVSSGLSRHVPAGAALAMGLFVVECLTSGPLVFRLAAPLVASPWTAPTLGWVGPEAALALAVLVARGFVTRDVRERVVAGLALSALVGVGTFGGAGGGAGSVRVGLLQEAPRESVAEAARAELRAHDTVARLAKGGASFVVRAEGVVPGAPKLVDVVPRVAEDVPVVAGVVLEEGDRRTNSLVVVKGRELAHRYDKRALVPLAEGAPFYTRPFRAAQFAEGTASPRTDALGEPVELGVCYEDVLAPDVDARLRVNATHDGWFEGTRGREVHLMMARLRAAEARRAVVRVTRDGLTVVLDRRGGVVARLPPREDGAALVDVPLGEPTSPALRGRLFFRAFAFLFVVLALWRGRNRLTPGTTT